MPPLILIAAGIVGGAALVRFALREGRRVNRELDEAGAEQLGGDVDVQRDAQQVLQRIAELRKVVDEEISE